jgi:hypothetical protein
MEIFIVVVLILLVIIVISFYRKTQSLKKIRQRLLNIPAFDSDLFDCYVKVSGHIKSDNAFRTPISNNHCAFYIVKVFALWETKEKKPAKGMEQHQKLIFNTVMPSTLLEVSKGKDIVYVDMPEFFDKADFLLHSQTVESRICPAVYQSVAVAKKKYQKYQVLESWCSHADQVVIYGKLVKTHEGLLCMKPTELGKFPSFICLQQYKKMPLEKLNRDIGRSWFIFIFVAVICILAVMGILMYIGFDNG